jgi:hypothetical protein
VITMKNNTARISFFNNKKFSKLRKIRVITMKNNTARIRNN